MRTQTDDVKLDNNGRMVYDPEFHPNHGKRFTESEIEYLCKYYEADGPRFMSLALGKTETTVANKVSELRKTGLYEFYKNRNENW